MTRKSTSSFRVTFAFSVRFCVFILLGSLFVRLAAASDQPEAQAVPALVTNAAADINAAPPPLTPAADMSAAPATYPAGEESATPRRFHYLASVTVREVYDDNINLTQANREDDFYTVIEPRITAGFGDIFGKQDNYLSLTYAPSAFLFADHSEDDAVQHIIRLEGQYAFPHLTLNLAQDVEILDGADLGTTLGGEVGGGIPRANLDVSGRTRLDIFNTRLSANYNLSGKTFLSAGVSYNVTDYENNLISSSVLSGDFYFNYIYSPRLALGVGATGGYDFVDSPSQDQTFQQLNVRASYEVTGKLSATASAGVEFRQIDGRSGEDVSPVFNGSLIYQPFDGTTLSLTVSRQILNSAVLVSQDFDATTVIVTARQRFLRRFFLGLAAGYENGSYFSTRTGVASDRDDDYYFFEPSIDFNITRFWTAGVYYLYRENDSSLAPFSFYDNQFGVRTTVSF